MSMHQSMFISPLTQCACESGPVRTAREGWDDEARRPLRVPLPGHLHGLVLPAQVRRLRQQLLWLVHRMINQQCR